MDWPVLAVVTSGLQPGTRLLSRPLGVIGHYAILAAHNSRLATIIDTLCQLSTANQISEPN